MTVSRETARLHRPGWIGVHRLKAFDRVRSAMADQVGLLANATAAAETILDIMGATSLSVILLDGDCFWDLINWGKLTPGEVRFPENMRYPMSKYPEATQRLLAGNGYLSRTATDQVIVEYRKLWPQVDVGSIMGAPIIARGQIRGELFLLRNAELPGFTTDDLDVVRDLATLFGARLPPALLTECTPGGHFSTSSAHGHVAHSAECNSDGAIRSSTTTEPFAPQVISLSGK